MKRKTIIIPNEIGRLNRSNKGYTQRPFSAYVPKKLKIKLKNQYFINFFKFIRGNKYIKLTRVRNK